jgi:RimJ/RimL family protein N-acetyltransferase
MPFAAPILTRRLCLRPWRVADAARLKDAIDRNLEHLRAWMPWAMDEPSSLSVIETRILKFEQDFIAGADSIYAIFSADESQVLGGTGLHPRIDDGVEIGYWLDHRQTGCGFATEAARALTTEAFRHAHIRRVQIRCDPRNAPSAGVPARLGFTHIETLAGDALSPDGRERDTMVWELRRPTAPGATPII